MKEIDDALASLATDIAAKVKEPEVSLGEKIKAFHVLTAYKATFAKPVKAKVDDEDENSSNIPALRRRIALVEKGDEDAAETG